MENQTCHQWPSRDLPRVKALPRALVFFPQGTEMLPYHIIDISEGGLSFQYLGEKINRSGIFSVSLYHEYELIAEDLPAKEISDIQLRDGLVPVRRGSLALESLTPEQKNRLSTFIKGFAEPLHLAPAGSL